MEVGTNRSRAKKDRESLENIIEPSTVAHNVDVWRPFFQDNEEELHPPT